MSVDGTLTVVRALTPFHLCLGFHEMEMVDRPKLTKVAHIRAYDERDDEAG